MISSCNSALGNASYGIILLPAAVQLSTALVKLTMTLEERPDLSRQLRKLSSAGGGGEDNKSLVERTAESIQKAFTTCLTDRSANRSGIGANGKPEGKKIGIYLFANLVLKLYFQSRKTRLANQLFTNVTQHSPPLYLYPASQRVTYLYYLGRFLFSNSHFYRAQQCLQQAYMECHRQAISQKRKILLYLLASNLILGRFFSPAFLSRPEGAGLLEKFAPIQKAIKLGDLTAFKHALGSQGGNEEWFFRRGLLLPLLYRAEPLVWRSLARRTFLLTYQFPTNPADNRAPLLRFAQLVASATYCQKRLEGYTVPQEDKSSMFVQSADLIPPPDGPRQLSAHEGVIYANTQPDIHEIEAIISSLVQQGLLHGFVAHNHEAFAILGSKAKGGPLNAGFPVPWSVFETRAKRDAGSDVPGWVKTERKGGMGGVVNLSGIARAAGSA